MQICQVAKLDLVDYLKAWDIQRQLSQARRQKYITDSLLLLEHPHTYTVGRSGKAAHILIDDRGLASLGASLYWVDRGGDVTYHGPGQLVGYPILHLPSLGLDAHSYLRALEDILIETLADFGIASSRVPGRTGVWVGNAKIAAIGVRIAGGVSSHGFALNVSPDLSYFRHIVPCGLADADVTSMQQILGRPLTVAEVIPSVIIHFANRLGLEMVDGHISQDEPIPVTKDSVALAHEERQHVVC